MNLLAGWDADHTIKIIALIGAAIGFLVGLMQYKKSQQWKRAEWVAQELKSFFGDAQVDAAFKMIDWSARDICLSSSKADEGRFVFVESEEVINALCHHSERVRGEDGRCFTEKEANIRDSFDKLCDGLERIESYITVGLIEERDIAPYLDYWGIHLRPDSESPRLRQIRKFMKHYGWEGAESLLDRFAPES